MRITLKFRNSVNACDEASRATVLQTIKNLSYQNKRYSGPTLYGTHWICPRAPLCTTASSITKRPCEGVHQRGALTKVQSQLLSVPAPPLTARDCGRAPASEPNLSDLTCKGAGDACLSGLVWAFRAQAQESEWHGRVRDTSLENLSSRLHLLFQHEFQEILFPPR